MGYKLAGYDVIGCNEIDPRMMKCYLTNHKPKYSFLEPIQDFKKRQDLPKELYSLDILDGSPPCSTFSMMGSREDAWGVEKKFKEGQQKQVLDTLFFDFIDLAERLQPKVVIAENVKGLLLGNAKDYVRRIYKCFDKAGYYCQHFLLNASKMGVPQSRERVFFLCLRKDLAETFLISNGLFELKPFINMDFNEEEILFGECADYTGREVNSPKLRALWEKREHGDRTMANAHARINGKHSCFAQRYLYEDRVAPTQIVAEDGLIHFKTPKYISKTEVCKITSYPIDYNFFGQKPHYLCGMSVPPVMMAQIATRVYDYWLSKLDDGTKKSKTQCVERKQVKECNKNIKQFQI